MRIAYVCADPGVPVFGAKGASIHVQEMLHAFLRRGAEVTIFSPRLGDPAPPHLAAVRGVALPPLAEAAAELRARRALAANAAVREALAAVGPFDLIYERHALFAHAAMEHARDESIPAVMEVNAPLIEEQARHRELVLPMEAEASARRAFAAAGLVSAVSTEVARYAVGFGARPQRVHVVPNAVDPARFPERPAPSGPFTIGFLGTLKPWHDVATLIEAFAQVRDAQDEARLLIVGDGPERASLASRLDRLGLAAAVEFRGAVPPAQAPVELARMHVGVAPYSKTDRFYFSPLKIYEYMAAGLPVVASRVGHLPEIVAEERTGLLCAPGDVDALAATLIRLARAPGLRAKLGKAARAEVLASHTWDGVAEQVLNSAALAPAPQTACVA